MSVCELLRSKWQATINRDPNPRLLFVVEAVEDLLAINESDNPVIPTMLNDQLLDRELKASPHFIKKNIIETYWLQADPLKKAAATQLLLGLFPEIDRLANIGLLDNLKALYEKEERPDEFDNDEDSI